LIEIFFVKIKSFASGKTPTDRNSNWLKGLIRLVQESVRRIISNKEFLGRLTRKRDNIFVNSLFPKKLNERFQTILS
jgi:hypothetical protein